MRAIESVRRVLPRALARNCLGNSPCIGGHHGFRQPTAAERLIEAYDGEDVRKPCLHKRILSLIERLLSLQHGDEVNRAFAQPLLRDIESEPRGRHLLSLQPFSLRSLANVVQRILYVRERGNHRFAVGLKELVLLAFCQIEIAEQLATVKNRLRQAGNGSVEGRFGPKQRFETRALIAALGGKLDAGKELRSSVLDIGVGGSQVGFRLPNVRTLSQKF